MTETQSVHEFFETLPSRIPAGSTDGIKNTYLFEVRDAGTWLVAVDGGTVTVTPGEAEADVRIGMSEDVFRKLLARELNPARAIMTGKLRVRGDVGAASKLQKILVR